MGLTKAKLIIEKEHTEKTINVLFNPSQYQLSDGAYYAEYSVPGIDGRIVQFHSGQNTELSLSLFLDTYVPKPTSLDSMAVSAIAGAITGKTESTDVSELTREIAKTTYIEGSLHRPPVVRFEWGSLHFKGVITRVNHTYTMFTESGMPVRAKVDLHFKSLWSEEGRRKSPFESPDRTKYRTIKDGIGLWELAYAEYGDSEMWKVIARENGILNPLDVKPGQVIKLPAI